MANTLKDARAELALANRIAANEGVIDTFGHVSMRHPDNPNRYFLSRSRAPDMVTVGRADRIRSRLAAGARSRRAAVFRARDPRRNLQGAAGRDGGVPPPFGILHAADRRRRRLCADLSSRRRSAASSRRTGISMTSSATPICWWSSRRRAPRSRARSAAHCMVLMRRHGVTVVGASVRECVYRCGAYRAAMPSTRCAP